MEHTHLRGWSTHTSEDGAHTPQRMEHTHLRGWSTHTSEDGAHTPQRIESTHTSEDGAHTPQRIESTHTSEDREHTHLRGWSTHTSEDREHTVCVFVCVGEISCRVELLHSLKHWQMATFNYPTKYFVLQTSVLFVF